MQNALLPACYFPPIVYFGILSETAAAFIESCETFPKQTFRNRCLILTANGILPLVIPVHKPSGNHTVTGEILISYRQDWPSLHWRAIESAYRSSPYFDHYAGPVRSLVFSGKERLIDHNLGIQAALNELLGIPANITLTTSYEKQPSEVHDFRLQPYFSRRPALASLPRYPQVFAHKFGFQTGLSILDLLFNLGPDSRSYVNSLIH